MTLTEAGKLLAQMFPIRERFREFLRWQITANIVKNERTLKGWTVAQLAQKTHLTECSINRLEIGKSLTPKKTLSILAVVLFKGDVWKRIDLMNGYD